MGLLENVRREQEQAMKAKAYDEMQNKARLGRAYEAGLAEMQARVEAMREAEAMRSMANMAQDAQAQYGEMAPVWYVSPQWTEPTFEERKRAQDSLVGLAEQARRGM